jgi:hypothetical protein
VFPSLDLVAGDVVEAVQQRLIAPTADNLAVADNFPRCSQTMVDHELLVPPSLVPAARIGVLMFQQ